MAELIHISSEDANSSETAFLSYPLSHCGMNKHQRFHLILYTTEAVISLWRSKYFQIWFSDVIFQMWNKNILFPLFPQTYCTLSYFWPCAFTFVSFNLQSGKQQKNRSEEFLHLGARFAYVTLHFLSPLWFLVNVVSLTSREHYGLVSINSHGECFISKSCMKEKALF